MLAIHIFLMLNYQEVDEITFNTSKNFLAVITDITNIKVMFLCNMEVLKIKIESFFDEKQDDLLDIKLMKKENETFTITNINTEQPSELLQDDVISMFSYSDDEDQDGSHYNVMNVKTEFEYRRDIEFELERTPEFD
ncbi:uncharacterized protein LOC143240973 isoform X2 [Tachypleus tridentatus]|uniref:uncharacterized protein LOC143240973 isoform X2 n=1 Tax=Tachypleus tridentatus TaxID=6853 RepID=UPI003FD667E4